MSFLLIQYSHLMYFNISSDCILILKISFQFYLMCEPTPSPHHPLSAFISYSLSNHSQNYYTNFHFYKLFINCIVFLFDNTRSIVKKQGMPLLRIPCKTTYKEQVSILIFMFSSSVKRIVIYILT